MFKNLKLGVLAVCGVGAFSAVGQDTNYSTASTIPADSPNWKMSLGISFRQMGEFDFKSFSLNGGDYFDGTFNGDGTPVTPNDPLSQTVPGAIPGTTLVSLHKGGSNGFSEDADDETGLVLGASKVMGYGKNWTYDLDLSLGFFSTSLDVNNAGDSITDVILESGGNGTSSGGDEHPSALPANLRNSYSMDMDAYVFSMGLGARMLMGPVELKLGAGPTVTLVDYDFERTSTVSFSTAAPVTESADDSGIDMILGAYLSAEVLYPINEKWTIGAGVRYDWAAYELETRVADVDLSGSSVELKVQYAF